MSPRTAKAVREVRRRGAHFAVISGRSLQSLTSVLRRQDIDFDGLFVIANNGAVVTRASDGEVLASHRLGESLAIQLLDEIERFPVTAHVAEGERAYAKNVTPEMIQFERAVNGADLVQVEDWASSGISPHKIQVVGDRADLRYLLDHLAQRFGDHTEAMFSAESLIEVTAKGVNKGRALVDLCQVLGVDQARTLGFGDNENDISLLQQSGHGVAVGNAVDGLVAVADRVTAHCTEDGVAVVLEEIFEL